MRFKHKSTPDTGATRTVCGTKVLRKHRIPFQVNYNVQMLLNASGEEMTCPGEIDLTIRIAAGTEITVNALVCDDVGEDILVAWHDLAALRVIPKGFPNTIVVEEASHISATQQRVMAASTSPFEAGVRRLKDEFSDVFSDTLKQQPMHGPPMKINLKEGSTPKKVVSARRVPLEFREEAGKALSEFLELGIIERVDPNTETEWVAPGFWVPKSDGKRVRLVTDYTALNRCIDAPTHPFPSARDIMQEVPADATVFFKLDCTHGYFQKALAEEDKLLTTFLLEQGKFCYRRSPMGLAPSSSSWCFSSDPLVEGLPYAKKIVDDVIGWGTPQTWEDRARKILLRAREMGITISLKKFEVGTEILFAGYTVGTRGVTPDPNMTESIAKFPAPTDKTELRSFLGLCNQLGFFVPDLAQMTAAMRTLLKKETAWLWTEDMQAEFESAKQALTSDLVVKPFDPEMETILLTDASRLKGLGFALMQRPRSHEGLDSHHLVQCGSCSLTDTQRRYAIVELEALAISWAVRKCHFWLAGRDFMVYTDHKPLEGVFRKDAQDVCNPRLGRIREKLMPYKFKVQWVPGKHHYIADALSRAPLFVKDAEEEQEDEPVVAAVARKAQGQAVSMDFIAKEASRDPEYYAAVDALSRGLTEKQLTDRNPARVFKSVWEQLSVMLTRAGPVLLFQARRLVIPIGAQPQVLRLLHLSHSGITKTRELANQLYFWHTMSKDIERLIKACEACQSRRPAQAEMPAQAPREPATYPMSHMGTDLFQLRGAHWLVLVDRFSGFPFVARLRRTWTADVVAVLTGWFRQFGWPRAIRTDGGPQFRGEFKEFCAKYGIAHELASPYNPQSNGLAEAAVKNMKGLIAKCQDTKEDIDTAIQAFRNTPRADGFSPSEMLFGRRQRCELPTLPMHHEELVDFEAAVAARDATAESQRAQQQRHAGPLRPLHEGEWVRIQDPLTHEWTVKGIVTAVREGGQSYELQTERGTLTTRNRKFLKPLADTPFTAEVPECADVTPVSEQVQHIPQKVAGPAPSVSEPRRSARLAERAQVAVSLQQAPVQAPPSAAEATSSTSHALSSTAAAPAATTAPIATSLSASGWFEDSWRATWARPTPSVTTRPQEATPTTRTRTEAFTSSSCTEQQWVPPRASFSGSSPSSSAPSLCTAASRAGTDASRPPSRLPEPLPTTRSQPLSYAAALSRHRTTSPSAARPSRAAAAETGPGAPTGPTTSSGSQNPRRPPGLYPQGSEREDRYRFTASKTKRGQR